MNRATIELNCQRIPKEIVYNGSVVIFTDDYHEATISFNFENEKLENIAIWVHYAVRLLSVTGVEFCVRMRQKAAFSVRQPVVVDFTPAQVSQIYESPEKAREFFTPKTITETVRIKKGE